MSGGTFWLASYPKSGNTWFRAFLANLLSEADAPVDLNALHIGSMASGREWIDDVLGIDTADLTPAEIMRLRPVAYDWLFTQASRFEYHKIHDAYLYEQNAPVFGGAGVRGALYLLRNPLDVAVSFAHHNGSSIDSAIAHMGNPDCVLAKVKKGLAFQLEQRVLTWSQHVLSWVNAKEIPVHVLRYEDMHADGMAMFSQAAAFLRLPHEVERVEKALSMTRFDRLQEQESQHGFSERSFKAERFFRKGIVGDWRNTLSSSQVEKIIHDHFDVMRQFDYVDADGTPH